MLVMLPRLGGNIALCHRRTKSGRRTQDSGKGQSQLPRCGVEQRQVRRSEVWSYWPEAGLVGCQEMGLQQVGNLQRKTMQELKTRLSNETDQTWKDE